MRGLIVGVIVGAGLVASAVAGPGAVDCRWRVVLNRPGPQLAGVAALHDDDVWAVGADASRGDILHWDGRAWRRTDAALLPLDVSAASATDVWVVGSSSPSALLSRSLSEHWTGVHWKVVAGPGGQGWYLRGVAALRRGDAWAVGATGEGPLLVHWDGRAWRWVATGVSDGVLQAIDLPWAVGTQGMTSLTGSEDPLVVRRRGGMWGTVTTPSIASVDENLNDVSAVSPSDVWAVGSEDDFGDRAPLIQRLYGRVWLDESVVGLPPARSALLTVAAFGPRDVWGAGYKGFTPERTLLAHWDGTRWTQMPSRPGSLSDVSALSPHDIWAVGSSGARSLVEHYTCD